MPVLEQNMNRRQFLASAAVTGSMALNLRQLQGDQAPDGRTFATPEAAQKSPPEKWGYVIGVYAGTDIKKPDYLATIDLDPASKTYSRVVHRLAMPNVGDELHHFGWNACASCHGQQRSAVPRSCPDLSRAASISSTRHDPRKPKLHKVIEPDEIVRKTKLTAPHTVHCLADGTIMISMLGDDKLSTARAAFCCSTRSSRSSDAGKRISAG